MINVESIGLGGIIIKCLIV